MGYFVDIKMMDTKTVMSQVQEFQVILNEIQVERMVLSEDFQVATIIEKLPPGWKDFKNYLKHERKEMSMEDLIVRLHIEEDNRRSKKRRLTPVEAKENIVEHGQSSKKNKFVKWSKLEPKGGVSKKPKLKVGHKSVDCKQPKKKKNEANIVDNITQEVADISLFAVVSKVNMVGSNPREWWIDIGATRHVYSNREMFITFELVLDGESLFMGNLATLAIEGRGNVILKMASGKEPILKNILYVSEIQRKNLVSGLLLNKHGFCMVFESNTIVLTKSGFLLGRDMNVGDVQIKYNKTQNE